MVVVTMDIGTKSKGQDPICRSGQYVPLSTGAERDGEVRGTGRFPRLDAGPLPTRLGARYPWLLPSRPPATVVAVGRGAPRFSLGDGPP